MRDIKFRAWCEEDKSMYYPDGNYEFHINSNAIYYSPRYDQQELYSYSTDKSEFEKEIVVMQFTGLFDKNDKEIYEGDIISSDNFSSNLVIGYSNEKAAFVGSRTNSFKISEIYNFLDDIVIDDNWEVIGNIYENPDLL